MVTLKTTERDTGALTPKGHIAQISQARTGNLARKNNIGMKDNTHKNSICSILRTDILSIEPSVLKDFFQVQN